jgi:hypothetical protein
MSNFVMHCCPMTYLDEDCDSTDGPIHSHFLRFDCLTVLGHLQPVGESTYEQVCALQNMDVQSYLELPEATLMTVTSTEPPVYSKDGLRKRILENSVADVADTVTEGRPQRNKPKQIPLPVSNEPQKRQKTRTSSVGRTKILSSQRQTAPAEKALCLCTVPQLVSRQRTRRRRLSCQHPKSLRLSSRCVLS